MTPDGDISFRIDEPVVLVGAAAFLLWALSERLMQLFRLRQPKAFNRERLSWYWVALSNYGAVLFSLFDAATYHWSIVSPNLAPARWLGVPLVLAGIGIRILARLTLGKHFSGHVQTTQGHRLITTGIYRSIRHPAYLGYLCLLLGFPICFGSLGGFAWAILSGIPALLYRIRIEEAALGSWFPGEYQRYQTTTHKLVPGLW
jgi:protein-S-isoprenylcysteine O-methyltransferase Ste14